VDTLIPEFATRVEPLGVQVDRIGSVEAAADLVRETALAGEVDDVVVSSELLDRYPALTAALVARGLTVQTPKQPEDSLDAPLGLTTAVHAVAETGSLLTAERTLTDRSVALLSLVCVAILPSTAILPGLDEAGSVLRRLAKQPGGAYATMITGPSRTADIEMSLTVGVQGPGRMIVVFIDEAESRIDERGD
jgi:L-lactate dehydrogenase complex protein LldG